MHTLPFDHDITLTELLHKIPNARLQALLTQDLGEHWHIVDGNQSVMGPGLGAVTNPITIPLFVDIEMIGELIAVGLPIERVEITATWLMLILEEAYRYHMVATLHTETVQNDYEALQHKHIALQASQKSYRELSEDLEHRVQIQVEIIDRAQKQLYQAEKMASVGSLAAGMAHEINNPIGFIRSNLTTAMDYLEKIQSILEAVSSDKSSTTQLLWQKMDLDFVLKDFPVLINESIIGANRIANIVANLKDFASIDDISTLTAIDFNQVVHTVINLINGQIAEDVSFDLDLQPLPGFICDRGRMNQVLLSLIQNALQALKGQGRIQILTRVVEKEIQIVISDNGCGMAADTMKYMFDPFFTTQDVGKGTGLGLTVSHSIITSYGGHITVDSTLGVGSTFTVCLPLISPTD